MAEIKVEVKPVTSGDKWVSERDTGNPVEAGGVIRVRLVAQPLRVQEKRTAHSSIGMKMFPVNPKHTQSKAK